MHKTLDSILATPPKKSYFVNFRFSNKIYVLISLTCWPKNPSCRRACYLSWCMQPEALWACQKPAAGQAVALSFSPMSPSFLQQTAFPSLCDCHALGSFALAFPCSSLALSLLPISAWDHGRRVVFPVSHGLPQSWPQYCMLFCPTRRLFCLVGC